MYASSLGNTSSRIFSTDPDFTKYSDVFKLTHAAVLGPD